MTSAVPVHHIVPTRGCTKIQAAKRFYAAWFFANVLLRRSDPWLASWVGVVREVLMDVLGDSDGEKVAEIAQHCQDDPDFGWRCGLAARRRMGHSALDGEIRDWWYAACEAVEDRQREEREYDATHPLT